KDAQCHAGVASEVQRAADGDRVHREDVPPRPRRRRAAYRDGELGHLAVRTGPFIECATIRRLLEVADYETANVARRRHPVRSGLNHARRGRTARGPLAEPFAGFSWGLGNGLQG